MCYRWSYLIKFVKVGRETCLYAWGGSTKCTTCNRRGVRKYDFLACVIYWWALKNWNTLYMYKSWAAYTIWICTSLRVSRFCELLILDMPLNKGALRYKSARRVPYAVIDLRGHPWRTSAKSICFSTPLFVRIWLIRASTSIIRHCSVV